MIPHMSVISMNTVLQWRKGKHSVSPSAAALPLSVATGNEEHATTGDEDALERQVAPPIPCVLVLAQVCCTKPCAN